jgi:hypothetical protein
VPAGDRAAPGVSLQQIGWVRKMKLPWKIVKTTLWNYVLELSDREAGLIRAQRELIEAQRDAIVVRDQLIAALKAKIRLLEE